MARPESPVRREIAGRIANLLQEGCVLTTEDVREVAAQYGFTSTIPRPSHFGERLYPDYTTLTPTRYRIGGIEALQHAVLGSLVIRSAELPIEETEYEDVKQEIHKRRQESARRGVRNQQLNYQFREPNL